MLLEKFCHPWCYVATAKQGLGGCAVGAKAVDGCRELCYGSGIEVSLRL